MPCKGNLRCCEVKPRNWFSRRRCTSLNTWSNGSAPSAGDDVQITSGTVNLNHNFTAGSLYLSGGTLSIGGNLTITGPDTFAFPTLAQYVPGAPTSFGFVFVSGTLGGSGTVTVNTTSLLFDGGRQS